MYSPGASASGGLLQQKQSYAPRRRRVERALLYRTHHLIRNNETVLIYMIVNRICSLSFTVFIKMRRSFSFKYSVHRQFSLTLFCFLAFTHNSSYIWCWVPLSSIHWITWGLQNVTFSEQEASFTHGYADKWQILMRYWMGNRGGEILETVYADVLVLQCGVLLYSVTS